MYSRGGSGSTPQLGLVEIDTGKLTILSSATASVVEPRFSADGKRVVYADGDNRGGDLWLQNVGTGAASRFTFDRRHVRGVWSTDGSQIATQTLRANDFESSIRFLATDGSGEVRPEVPGFNPSFDAKWSVMSFTRYSEETKWDIWYMPLEGEHEPKPLIATPASERGSAISPDGNWLAYGAEGNMWIQLFLTRFPSAVGKWQVSPGMGLQPRWSNGGKRLYFVDQEKGLQVVDLDLSAGVQISPPRAVFKEPVVGAMPALGYDIDSAGKRVIVPISPPGSASRSIVIVQNWYEAFRDQPR